MTGTERSLGRRQIELRAIASTARGEDYRRISKKANDSVGGLQIRQ